MTPLHDSNDHDGCDDVAARLAATGQTLTGEPQARWSFLAGKAARHVAWLRTQGLRRLIEEDQLDPVDRAGTWLRKRRWQRQCGAPPGSGRVVFVVGLQRSGTNMVLRAVDRSPQTQVYNENSRQAFHRFRLVDARVGELAARSRARAVLFKPLCDSHRLEELLALPAGDGTRALWIYRSVDGRVRSTLAKFGDHDHAVIGAIASGRGGALWQAGGLSEATLETIRSFDTGSLSPASASALFWWARNRLVMERGWFARDDVLLVSYDRVLATPAAQVGAVCDFIGVDVSAGTGGDVDHTRASRPTLDIDPAVRALCTELTAQLDAVALAATPRRVPQPAHPGAGGDAR